MVYLEATDIAYIHDRILESTGGAIGLREPGLLDAIINKPKASFDGQDLYPDLFAKVAALYEALCNYHVFLDGNKRTAAISMYRFLAVNGHDLTVTNYELETYTLTTATTPPDLHAIANWIRSHSNKSPYQAS
jgi:death-on-curing protein